MMNLTALILYGLVNVTMVLSYLRGKGRFYQFPFWAGVIALGWFYPQAIGGYLNDSEFPSGAYANSMVFATLCTVALWSGFDLTVNRRTTKTMWLDAAFNARRLYYVGVVLCLFGFFFQWKLWSLPEEMLLETQWSGSTVKYLFLANVFKIGFASLWLLYLRQPRVFVPRLLMFIVPCLLLFLDAAFLRGRRAGMMDLVSYLFLGVWFVRRIAIPRWFIIAGLSLGLILINGIRTYRLILMNKEMTLSERLSEAARADYLKTSKERLNQSGSEFKNYIYFRQVHDADGIYDFGAFHWDAFVFNYVPAQIVGREFKESLMLEDPTADDPQNLAREKFGYKRPIGTTITGYCDSFGSFGWLGFVKFLLIGCIMGALYRHAMQDAFLGQLLYVYVLTTGMQSISHGTNDILIRVWIYFFMLGYPVLYWARIKVRFLENHKPV